MKIFILILNYNRSQDTLSCIKSIKKSDLPLNSKIVVLNNGSDKLAPKKLPKEIKFIQNKGNFGFAGGNNPGIKYALRNKASHVLILNPDTLIPKTFFKPLLFNMKRDKDIGLIAPAHRHEQKEKIVFGLDGRIDWKTGKCVHKNVNEISSLQLKYCQFVSFACVLIKSSVFKKTGLLDERYFMYLEDVDFCLTASQMGFKIALDPKVVIEHKASASFSDPRGKLKYSFASQIKLLNKWLSLKKRIQPLLYTFFFYPYLYLLWSWHRIKYSK